MRSGGAPFRLEPLLHRLADRDDAVGAAQVEARQRPSSADEHRVLEPLQLDRDLREDVLADHDERHAEAPRDEQSDVADDRRIGHAEDDVGPSAAQGRSAARPR